LIKKNDECVKKVTSSWVKNYEILYTRSTINGRHIKSKINKIHQ